MDVSLEAQRTWATTPRGKLLCPECGHAGYRGGKWVSDHVEHVTCTCGSVVTKRGHASHRAGMARGGHPCPEVAA